MSNQNIILISGKTTTGKTMSLRGIENPEGVIYMNTEANKALPFAVPGDGFRQINITDPAKVEKVFMQANKMDDVHTLVIDSLTYLMDLYESRYVLNAPDTRSAWGEYAQYFKRLMQRHVAESTKNVVFLAHTSDVLNEREYSTETMVKVKGSLMNQGIESYFSNVISTKKVLLDDLDPDKTPLLNITEDDEYVGHKYVFQTRLTRDTVHERIRGPIGMWSQDEVYIDNNLQFVLNRLHEYYNK